MPTAAEEGKINQTHKNVYLRWKWGEQNVQFRF